MVLRLFIPLLLLPVTFFLAPTITSYTSALESVICNAAFRSLAIHSTAGLLYKVHLPVSLSAIDADVSRYRSGSLSRYGAAIKEFKIPRGVAVCPYATRLILVRGKLGNLSSIYSNISGFHLISPVVGLRPFELTHSCTTELELVATGEPITVYLTTAFLAYRSRSICTHLNVDGAVTVFDAVSRGICIMRGQGRFALVSRRVQVLSAPKECDGRNGRGWKVPAVSAATGVFMVVLLGMVGVAVLKTKRRRRKVVEMERTVYENEALWMSMVGNVRAPAAGASRTAGEIEEEEVVVEEDAPPV